MSDTPTRLIGKKVKAIESIQVPDVGTQLNPVNNLHLKNPTFHYQNDISIKDISADNLTKFKVKTDGVMEATGGLHLHSGNDTEAVGSKRFSVTLDAPAEDDFVIKDEVNNVDRIKIDGTTGVITFNPPLGSAQSSGYRFVWNTQGITPYNRIGTNLQLQGKFYDPVTARLRYDSIFYGAPPSGAYAWNQTIAPVTTPNAQFILNQSPIPGFPASGFVSFNGTGKTPVKVNVKGKFFPVVAPRVPDGALCDANPMFPHPYQAPFYTSNYTIRVGWIRQYYDPGLPGLVQTELCGNDYTIPIRGNSVHDCLDFSADFVFEMTRADLSTGTPHEYVPYFNHNGYVNSAGVEGSIRWREVQVTMDTLEGIP